MFTAGSLGFRIRKGVRHSGDRRGERPTRQNRKHLIEYWLELLLEPTGLDHTWDNGLWPLAGLLTWKIVQFRLWLSALLAPFACGCRALLTRFSHTWHSVSFKLSGEGNMTGLASHLIENTLSSHWEFITIKGSAWPRPAVAVVPSVGKGAEKTPFSCWHLGPAPVTIKALVDLPALEKELKARLLTKNNMIFLTLCHKQFSYLLHN